MPLQWSRLLTDTHRPDLRTGLEARVYDPLWLLARQWQMGEFHGEDAGSPVLVTVESDAFPIDRVHLGTTTRAYTPAEAPLEAVVERETPEQAPPDLRTRAQLGLLLVRRLEQAGLPCDRTTLLARCGFAQDAVAAPDDLDIATQLLLRRAPDGSALYRYCTSTALTEGRLHTLLSAVTASTFAAYCQVITAWVATYEAQVGHPGQGDAWRAERLEYGFRVSVPTDVGRVELAAPEYLGGRLDRDAFIVHKVDTSSTSTLPLRRRDTVLPSPVTYRGMPAPRWWQFEDAAVDFGNPEANERDLGRLLLAEFVMSWGNDWFQIPLEVPMGTLCRINDLLVTDTFGVTTRIVSQRRHSPHWGMHQLSQAPGTPNLDHFLFVPPVLPAAHQAPPLEDVFFVRDEMANMAWAIEHTVADALGHPQPAARPSRSGPQELVRLQADDVLRYQVMTDLPVHWIPLVPVRDATTRTHFLARAGLLDEMQVTAPTPQGSLLHTTPAFRVHEEEIPRVGVHVSRAYQLARWYDGCRTVWIGKRKRAGIGEMRSALEFDSLLAVG